MVKALWPRSLGRAVNSLLPQRTNMLKPISLNAHHAQSTYWIMP
ncbi:ser/threonine protein phosphatase [Acetobacter orientalis]|uniref:Ser/threonine protein phosphatase n=1 Tax=Acetobacter orientalis TaxID=146474 RepID=A0A2Z5ZHD0_9PROT|nr:ser/threonine protein phosphatase [Acetobacter orientalis]